MALIQKAKGRKDGSGYTRLFDNQELGHLISRVQAAVISSGNELERIIRDRLRPCNIPNLDVFLDQETISDGVHSADKHQVKACKRLKFKGTEPDFIIFKRRCGKQKCHLIELKDGDSFDTKKAAAEHLAMREFMTENAQHLQYILKAHFCCFNQDDKKIILTGFKNKITSEEAMTGREFCELLEIDYNEILDFRTKNNAENMDYFLSELVKITAVRKWIGNHPV